MMIVPTAAVPSQLLTVNLANQTCQLALYQTAFGLFMNVSVNNAPIIEGVLCQNLNRIVRDAYLGFDGDFVFIDNAGTANPYFTGLGGQFSLAYLTQNEVDGIEAAAAG